MKVISVCPVCFMPPWPKVLCGLTETAGAGLDQNAPSFSNIHLRL